MRPDWISEGANIETVSISVSRSGRRIGLLSGCLQMKYVLKVKFKQYGDLRRELLATRGRKLIEVSISMLPGVYRDSPGG